MNIDSEEIKGITFEELMSKMSFINEDVNGYGEIIINTGYRKNCENGLYYPVIWSVADDKRKL